MKFNKGDYVIIKTNLSDSYRLIDSKEETNLITTIKVTDEMKKYEGCVARIIDSTKQGYKLEIDGKANRKFINSGCNKYYWQENMLIKYYPEGTYVKLTNGKCTQIKEVMFIAEPNIIRYLDNKGTKFTNVVIEKTITKREFIEYCTQQCFHSDSTKTKEEAKSYKEPNSNSSNNTEPFSFIKALQETIEEAVNNTVQNDSLQADIQESSLIGLIIDLIEDIQWEEDPESHLLKLITTFNNGIKTSVGCFCKTDLEETENFVKTGLVCMTLLGFIARSESELNQILSEYMEEIE